jgi:glycerophosphoryl diester phosphodiesterase
VLWAILLVPVALLALLPPTAAVQAAGMFGALRSPGEAAFVAAHRGDRSVAPENTLAALSAALDGDLEFVEMDVQLTSDRVPVLFHDETIDRTTNGSGHIGDYTARQLERLDAGSWYDPAFAGERIPRLTAFLDLFAGSDKKAIIELKGYWNEADVALVAGLVRERGTGDRVVFSSKDLVTMGNLRDVAGSFPRIIVNRDLGTDPVGFARRYGAMAILTTTESVQEHPTAITDMHAAGLGVLLYTLNSKETWTEALNLGVDGIVTDKPSRLDAWLAQTAPGT